MTYYVGDSPAEDLVIEPARADDEPIDLTPFDSCTVTLRDEAGAEVVTAGFLATIEKFNEPQNITVEWPGGNIFATAGLYSLIVVLESDAGARERLAPIYFAAQGDDGWLTLDAAREDWADAADIPDRTLYDLLTVAKNDVIAFAPALAADVLPPTHYRKAQGMQARNIWNASRVDPASGGTGEDSFAIRIFPLDWSIRQSLRPKRGIPVIV